MAQIGSLVTYITLFIQMDYPIHIDTVSLELSILYFKGLLVKNSLKWCVLYLKIFHFSKQCRPQYHVALICAAFYQGIHCLSKYLPFYRYPE